MSTNFLAFCATLIHALQNGLVPANGKHDAVRANAHTHMLKTDVMLESLYYDTTIFMFIVFQARNLEGMIVYVLALELFTMIDDEVKAVLLNYDSSFLGDLLVDGKPITVEKEGMTSRRLGLRQEERAHLLKREKTRV